MSTVPCWNGIPLIQAAIKALVQCTIGTRTFSALATVRRGARGPEVGATRSFIAARADLGEALGDSNGLHRRMARVAEQATLDATILEDQIVAACSAEVLGRVPKRQLYT